VFFIGAFLAMITFGIGFLFNFLGLVVWIMTVVFSIMGFLAVKDGGTYRYPVSVRFIK